MTCLVSFPCKASQGRGPLSRCKPSTDSDTALERYGGWPVPGRTLRQECMCVTYSLCHHSKILQSGQGCVIQEPLIHLHAKGQGGRLGRIKSRYLYFLNASSVTPMEKRSFSCALQRRSVPASSARKASSFSLKAKHTSYKE